MNNQYSLRRYFDAAAQHYKAPAKKTPAKKAAAKKADEKEVSV